MVRILWLLALAPAGLGVGGCATTAVSAETAQMREIDVQTLAADLDKQAVPVLIDVRTPAEFASGHVPGARNIPLDQIAERAAEIDANGEVYLVCRSGSRSARAAGILDQRGYSTVNIKGGTLAWQAAGLPTE